MTYYTSIPYEYIYTYVINYYICTYTLHNRCCYNIYGTTKQEAFFDAHTASGPTDRVCVDASGEYYFVIIYSQILR